MRVGAYFAFNRPVAVGGGMSRAGVSAADDEPITILDVVLPPGHRSLYVFRLPQQVQCNVPRLGVVNNVHCLVWVTRSLNWDGCYLVRLQTICIEILHYVFRGECVEVVKDEFLHGHWISRLSVKIPLPLLELVE